MAEVRKVIKVSTREGHNTDDFRAELYLTSKKQMILRCFKLLLVENFTFDL